MSRIIVDSIRNSSASSDGITLSSDGKVTFPNTSTGKILQYVHTFKKDAFSDTSGNWVAITGMSVTITAASTSNKLLFNCNLMYGINNLQVFRVRLYDGTSEITASRSTVASTDNNNGWLADQRFRDDPVGRNVSSNCDDFGIVPLLEHDRRAGTTRGG